MFNRFILAIKRPIIWFVRFPNRCGYGVHSPFAFNLITQVIYEKTPYYKYKTLKEEVISLIPKQSKGWNDASIKVNRLLFRLVNWFQPATIVDLGARSSSSLYLQAANMKALYLSMDAEGSNQDISSIDFLYIHLQNNPEAIMSEFNNLVNLISPGGLCVIKGIHHSRDMKQCWKRLVNNEKVGITFDLYDVGVLFFDKTKIKQDYIVNF